MYSYKDPSFSIKKEAVLSRVKQESIFQMALGFTPREYEYLTSPFRDDNTPGCYFEWYKGTLYFIDWTLETKRRHRDCFNAVQDIFGVNFNQALLKISHHFGLESESEVYRPPKNKKKTKKKVQEISFKARAFNSKEDKDYWSKRYKISKENLIEDNVFPIVWYKVYSKKLKNYVVIRPHTRTYCIGRFDSRVKIYTPDQQGRGKWVTNCTQHDIGGSGESTGELLVITKSYKDYRVLKNQGLNVRWNQNEGMMPSEKILIPLVSGFKKVCILFDNDSAGLRSAKQYVQTINNVLSKRAYSLTVPVSNDIKDPSDLIHRKGEAHLRKFLSEQNLITN